MSLGTYLHSDLSCSRGDSVSTLQTSSSCAKGELGTQHILCCLVFKTVFCSTKIQNSIMFSSESSKRKERINPYIPGSWSKGQSAGKVIKQYFDDTQSGVRTLNDKRKTGAGSLTLPSCRFHDNHIILKTKETLKNRSTFKITKYTALGNTDTIVHTDIHLSALKWITQIEN